MLVDIPFIHGFVRRPYITGVGNNFDYEECYIFAMTCIASRPPLFTCHLRSGAVFSRLPLEAFVTTSGYVDPDPALVPWTCVGHRADVLCHEYLKDYTVKVLNKDLVGRYLFTIDYTTGNYSEDSEQHKTHNVIALLDGRIAAMPNNYCRFIDQHFVDETLSTGDYRRQRAHWTAG